MNHFVIILNLGGGQQVVLTTPFLTKSVNFIAPPLVVVSYASPSRIFSKLSSAQRSKSDYTNWGYGLYQNGFSTSFQITRSFELPLLYWKMKRNRENVKSIAVQMPFGFRGGLLKERSFRHKAILSELGIVKANTDYIGQQYKCDYISNIIFAESDCWKMFNSRRALSVHWGIKNIKRYGFRCIHKWIRFWRGYKCGCGLFSTWMGNAKY